MKELDERIAAEHVKWVELQDGLREKFMAEGGPAFPQNGNSFSLYGKHDGMTVRMWLAGQAVSGLLGGHLKSGVTFVEIANEAVGLADAVLAELEKKP